MFDSNVTIQNKILPYFISFFFVLFVCLELELVSKLQFLDKCLDVPATCFKTGNKEKAWTKFHVAMLNPKNVEPISNFAGQDVSTWLCFALFEEMTEYAFCSKESEVQVYATTLNKHDKDVISYVGGAVVQKLRQRAYRLKDSSDKNGILDCVQNLSVDEARKGSMTEMLDRGGLVKLHPRIELLFESLEIKFRSLFKGFSVSLPFEAFFHESMTLDEVSAAFHNQLYNIHSEETLKEKLLRDLIFLFFKIRTHHQCKTFMDDFYKQTHKEKREKGLRKRLRQNAK